MKTLIISNEEVNDIIKIVKSIEESGLLIKSVSKTKEKKVRFLGMSLCSLGASLLGNLLIAEGQVKETFEQMRIFNFAS